MVSIDIGIKMQVEDGLPSHSRRVETVDKVGNQPNGHIICAVCRGRVAASWHWLPGRMLSKWDVGPVRQGKRWYMNGLPISRPIILFIHVGYFRTWLFHTARLRSQWWVRRLYARTRRIWQWKDGRRNQVLISDQTFKIVDSPRWWFWRIKLEFGHAGLHGHWVRQLGRNRPNDLKKGRYIPGWRNNLRRSCVLLTAGFKNSNLSEVSFGAKYEPPKCSIEYEYSSQKLL